LVPEQLKRCGDKKNTKKPQKKPTLGETSSKSCSNFGGKSSG
jgi:hypothetical protein